MKLVVIIFKHVAFFVEDNEEKNDKNRNAEDYPFNVVFNSLAKEH